MFLCAQKISSEKVEEWVGLKWKCWLGRVGGREKSIKTERDVLLGGSKK